MAFVAPGSSSHPGIACTSSHNLLLAQSCLSVLLDKLQAATESLPIVKSKVIRIVCKLEVAARSIKLLNLAGCIRMSRWQLTHVHLKPIWQHPPGSWAAVHLPGIEQAF